MLLSEASREFAREDRISAIRDVITNRKNRRASLTGLAGSAISMLLGGLALSNEKLKGLKAPMLIVADDMTSAGYVYNDLVHILGDEGVAIFPSGYKRDIKYGQTDSAQQILRTDVLTRLRTDRSLRYIVSYPEALAEKVADRKMISGQSIDLRQGEEVEMSKIVARLIELGFNSVEYVFEPGQFARRGSILDIYSYSGESPYRIDFFDTEIDSIREFNVETQLSERKLQSVTIVPSTASETTDGVSLPEYMGEDITILCQNPEFIIERVRSISKEEFSESAMIADEGDPDSMKRVVDADDFAERFLKSQIIRYGMGEAPASFGAAATIRFNCTLQTLYHKNFDLISESFINFEKGGYQILLLSDSQYQEERLKRIFEDRGDDIKFKAVSSTLHEGFVDHDGRVCYFTDHQIFDRFHNYSLRSDKARAGKVALSLRELNQIEVGDYIVHIDHGIGKFGGLVRTDVNGKPQEMIKLFYQNNDLVLVSIHALHKLSKYRGQDGIAPKISKLGGGSWTRMKERAKGKMKDMARELIALYAQRRLEKGHAFAPDSYLQHELEASFAYEDTPDQIRAVEAVKRDMEQEKPMDRLICGDVGFGKTEIAVRAAFKAAVDGKQTALLVPTTVLALQHYQTFSKRLKDLPVRVEFLSRAKKPKEIKQILADLEEGKIDILIGTHKLIGKSVKFKDLGLLIVDEEQKFGVAVKEKLKQLKVNVDTLTMSATPIPRTLQFSLMGARDLSSLNTPPANRHPIVTNVSMLDDDVVKEAIEFELSRNGQIFFVSNRIENLTELETKIRRLVPGIRMVTAHGQMPPEQLEKRILDFANHDYDLLLSTTIVENGVDMPNVNTILVNNAQNFGLSELHQLRGRVGRSDRKAFCYLLVPPGAQLTPIARRRLQAIENFSELGSGIHIAMQDLDIRGAGNLLGAEQSGFISDLGYEAYQQILRESLSELKMEEFGETFADKSAGAEEEYVNDVTIESDLELRIPGEYVPQENERINLYRRLDNMERKEQIADYRRELEDRFGKIPEVTEELIKVVPLRMGAKRLGMERIALKGGAMRIFFVGDENLAYYQSNAFGKVLKYLQGNYRDCELKESNGKRMMIVKGIGSVSAALGVIEKIMACEP